MIRAIFSLYQDRIVAEKAPFFAWWQVSLKWPLYHSSSSRLGGAERIALLGASEVLGDERWLLTQPLSFFFAVLSFSTSVIVPEQSRSSRKKRKQQALLNSDTTFFIVAIRKNTTTIQKCDPDMLSSYNHALGEWTRLPICLFSNAIACPLPIFKFAHSRLTHILWPFSSTRLFYLHSTCLPDVIFTWFIVLSLGVDVTQTDLDSK